jgi:hypothetical protein
LTMVVSSTCITVAAITATEIRNRCIFMIGSRVCSGL